MRRTLTSLAITFLVGVLIWFGLGVVRPDIYVEKAFVWIVYPSIAAGFITVLVWRQGNVAPNLQIRPHVLPGASDSADRGHTRATDSPSWTDRPENPPAPVHTAPSCRDNAPGAWRRAGATCPSSRRTAA